MERNEGPARGEFDGGWYKGGGGVYNWEAQSDGGDVCIPRY